MPVDAYCKGCIYLISISTGKCCNYLEVKHERRGCPAGDGCDKYMPGSSRRTVRPPIPRNTAEKKPDDSKAQKPKRPTPMTPEEAYERDKALRRERAVKFKALSNGRQRSVIESYRLDHGYTKKQLAEIVGVHPAHLTKWITEYAPANWDKLAKIGIQRPEGL